MTINNLTASQREQLKITVLEDVLGYEPSYGEIAAADEIVSDKYIAETAFAVGKVVRKAEYCHYLARNGDDEMILAGHTVYLSAESDNNISQRSVVHIKAALKNYAPRVYFKLVALLNVIVNYSAEQVVGRCDGVHIPGKMKVYILHWNNLSVSAAGGSALDAEHRTE